MAKVDLALFTAAHAMNRNAEDDYGVYSPALGRTRYLPIKGVDGVLKIIPPLTNNIPRLVRKRHKCKLAAALFIAQLFGLYKEGGTDCLVCNQIIG